MTNGPQDNRAQGVLASYSSANFILSRKEYRQRATFNHWQLKDLVCCPDNPDEVYYTDHTTVYCHNTRTGEHTDVLQLDYHPTAITVGHGYVCAVGSDSAMTVRCLRTGGVLFSGKCSTTINNSCIVRKHGEDDLRLMVCLNEEKIRVYSLPSMMSITDIPVNTQVNYCDVSPDGRLLVAVGDDHSLYVYEVHGYNYIFMDQIKAYDDCSFSCCFSPDGLHCTAASQDGTIVIFRVLDNKFVHTSVIKGFKSTGQTVAQAIKYCRAVKYSPLKGIDLIAFTESTSYIHILDVLKPENHQTIRVAPNNEETDICGLCFSPDSRYLYVALQDRLVQLEVDLAARRCRPAGCYL